MNIIFFISILIYWYLGLPITINQPDAANDKLEGAAWLIALIGILYTAIIDIFFELISFVVSL